jgi:AAA domain
MQGTVPIRRQVTLVAKSNRRKMQNQSTSGDQPNFQLEFIQPYSTFSADGTAPPTPFVVDGLLTQGGLSVLGAKPKVGKSSLSRYLAVSVAKGVPFLGRDTTQGDVILCSLEDPRAHVDNCLAALDYRATDSSIQIVERVAPDKETSVVAIRDALTANPNVRLVIIDHLAKFLNLPDLSDYMPTLRGIGLLHELARAFPHVHILCLAHSKKVRCEDPFDGILGSTALRGEPDTNIVLMNEGGERVIVTETRAGRPIHATILKTEMVTSAGCDVVKDFALGEPFDQSKKERMEKLVQNQTALYGNRIIDFLAECDGQTATQKEIVVAVVGKTERIVDAIKHLESQEILSTSGTPKSVHLEMTGPALNLHRLARRQS